MAIAEITGREKIGSTRYVTVSGISVMQVERIGLRAKSVNGATEIAYSNNSDYSDIIDLIDAVNAEPVENKTNGKRHIERHDVAVANGMNHGKQWVASGYDIDKNSLNPSWEGVLVCYVYHND